MKLANLSGCLMSHESINRICKISIVMGRKHFPLYAWFSLIFVVAVMQWGAFVRATGSGAGCGRHWPTCQGEVIPREPELATLIEFIHRATSGFSLLLVVFLVFWAWRVFEPKSKVRKAALFSLIFMIGEALLGAGLVLFELVAKDKSVARAIVVPLHLCNTFLLLASMEFVALFSQGTSFSFKLLQDKFYVVLAGISLIFIAATGAVTALGDTLFPSSRLADDFSSYAHFLVRLRVIHPLVAVTFFVFLVWLIFDKLPKISSLATLLLLLCLLQLVVGLLNIYFQVPLILQHIHLLFAQLIWLVYLAVVVCYWPKRDVAK